MEEIKIKRICKPGEPNANGRTYSLDSYNRAIEEYQNIAIKTGTARSEIMSTSEYTNPARHEPLNFYTVNLPKTCGKIIEVADDDITIIPDDENASRRIIDLVKKDKIRAYMRYTGNSYKSKPTEIDRIITFDLLFRD